MGAPPPQADCGCNSEGDSPTSMPTMNRPRGSSRTTPGVWIAQRTGSDSSEDGVRFWEASTLDVSGSECQNLSTEDPHGERDLGSFKYKDNTTLVQAVPLDVSSRHITTAVTLEQQWPPDPENIFADLLWSKSGFLDE